MPEDPPEKTLSITEFSVDRADEEEEVPPEYVFPLFLTSKTQEIFYCKVDKDVTAENPLQLIKKEDIFLDFKERAAISDFHPAKSIIQDYPGEELLMVYDPLFKYGQNFFLVTTEDGKEQILNPPEPITEVDQSLESVPLVPVRKSPKPWVSLGSEDEILAQGVFSSREKVSFWIQRKRRDFGAQVGFSDRNSSEVKDSAIDYPGYEDESFDLNKMELEKAIQNVSTNEDASSQTEWPRPRNANVQYEPRMFTQGQLAGIIGAKGLKDFLADVADRFELALQHNETIDIFVDDYFLLTNEDSTFGSKSDNHLKEYQSFTDLKFSKNKAITKIQWHPTIRGIIAVSCAEQLSFDERIDHCSRILMNPSFILLWSFADPIHPLLLMEAPDDILCFQFNPSNPNMIAAGCINGQVVVWDISQYSERLLNHRNQAQVQSKQSRTTLPSFLNLNKQELSPVVRYGAVSNIEHSHKMAITDIQWVPDHLEIGRMGIAVENKPAQCHQLITAASDGQILFWDTRPNKTAVASQVTGNANDGPAGSLKHLDLTWKPFLKVQVRQLKGSGDLSAIRFSISERQGDRSDDKSKQEDDVEELGQPFDRKSSVGLGLGRKKEENKVLENVNSKFYVATEDGELVYIDWKLSKDIDTGKVVSPRPELVLDAHDGPITAIERSPFFKDVILTAGGWSFAIWKEKLTHGPLLVSSSHPVKLTAAAWSPSRPAVFFIGKSDGSVDVWDLLDKTHEPFLNQSVTPVPIQTIFPYQVSSKQQLLAIGDKIGTLHIFEVPWNLRQPSSNEVTSVDNYFEREARRLAFLEQRERNADLDKKEVKNEVSNKVKLVEEDLEWESKARSAYQDYMELERQILEELGLSSDRNKIDII